ncbi:hypothetical protein D9M68_749930 [compost metagenome]
MGKCCTNGIQPTRPGHQTFLAICFNDIAFHKVLGLLQVFYTEGSFLNDLHIVGRFIQSILVVVYLRCPECIIKMIVQEFDLLYRIGAFYKEQVILH